ncbi:MAG: asparagine synthase (glutamine-hydrolyzing) [Niastella sp.]|jgi:asparagine synthase (glutamine-hydrolysing)|uniref:asparagine synthase (glutamine-hydrolyzing) n=1 Tax=Niastella sp. TaxID=1869183 RepID=UPI00389AC985
MCGICGFIKFNNRTSGEDAGIIRKMNSKLFHRGPDAQDTLLFDNVALGFSRLSIIGLENGMQPIYNEDGSLVLVCNGEIFNHIEIREELQKAGHVFKTRSDVEVIVHLYEQEGMEFLNKLNGQFAFALYDKRIGKLLCARDPMGICPLYYTLVENTFIFGSEIKAILEHPLVPREVDLVGLDQVFTFAGLISPRTMFRHINSLENGHYIIVNDQGVIQNNEYWDLIYPEQEMQQDGHPEKYYIDKLEEYFERSIQLRLRADVPSGLYLSGGLDSSMITMKVSQLYPTISKEVFSIDFAESNISETPYQILIANESRSKLNKKTFYFKDISERLKQAIYHCECPLKETYNTASLSLSEATRAKGIKVILSGEGSDELFAGYVGYRFDKMRAMNFVQNATSPEEEDIRERIWGDKTLFYENNFQELETIKRGLYSDAVNEKFDEVNCLNHPVINKERLRNRDVLNKRSYIDYKLRLVDHLVTDHGDKMALANSVEVRYPFLDKDLIAFSTQVPPELKLKDFTEKYVVKGMASRFVPKKIIDREKFGFIAPGSPYLLQNNIEYIEQILSYDLIRKQGYFNPDRIEELKNTYRQKGFTLNIPFESDLLITVITFGILLEEYFS